jgi:hypothetical protein
LCRGSGFVLSLPPVRVTARRGVHPLTPVPSGSEGTDVGSHLNHGSASAPQPQEARKAKLCRFGSTHRTLLLLWPYPLAAADSRLPYANRRFGAFRSPADVRSMGRPRRVPDRGDIPPPALVAQRLGLSIDEFNQCRSALERRGFPEPDATAGLYAIEAIDRWRLRRYPRLFPELAGAPTAVDANSGLRARWREAPACCGRRAWHSRGAGT